MHHDPPQRSQALRPATAHSVALVNMPFGSAERPSIQLGLVAAIASDAGFHVEQYHFNLALASQIGPELYESLCRHRGEMTGEWLFAPSAFGPGDESAEASFFSTFPSERDWAERTRSTQYFTDLRRTHLTTFTERCFESTDWSNYIAVGFSSTFQQNVASLALARRIKTKFPDVAIVFGGANMEGEMGVELMRAFPFVDFGVSGEAEHAFPLLLRALAQGAAPSDVPGVLTRSADGQISGEQAPPLQLLDEAPIPAYAAYFETAARLGLTEQYGDGWVIPIETSRGCWWGQKQHCTFCGLNGVGMGFRSKTPDRVFSELSELSARYRISNYEAVDNILDTRYLQSVFGRIEESRCDFQFFFEVKANLTQLQLRQLRRGGVRSIQPGIESMSSHVLKLMRKGCNMLQNVLCLKWSLYYGIRVSWNLLWGFPGETESDYESELRVLSAISHLEPPISCSRIWLERFSPYYTAGDTYGVHSVSPKASYQHVYPAHVNLDQLAYFFDYEMTGTLPLSVHEPTIRYVEEWNRQWKSEQRHLMSYRRTPGTVFVDYRKGPEECGTIPLSGELADIYEYCGPSARTPRQTQAFLREHAGVNYSDEELRETLDEFCRAGLMLSENDRYISLAIPSNPNW